MDAAAPQKKSTLQNLKPTENLRWCGGCICSTAAAVQLTAAYHNRGRSKLQFGWIDDAWEDFAIAGGIASSSLHVTHRVRKVAQLAAKQAALAAVAAAKVAAKTVATTEKRKPLRSRKKKAEAEQRWRVSDVIFM